MKKLIYSFIAALLVLLVIQGSLIAQPLLRWQYFQPITITNANANPLTTFQVKLTLNTAAMTSAGKLQASGNDIRFTDNTGNILLPYWIESGMNTATTIVWVKVPALPVGNTDIRFYYGNSFASTASNGEATFLLFDDFSGSSVDDTKWTEIGSSNPVSISAGIATFTGASDSRVLISNASFAAPYWSEMNVTVASGQFPNIAQLDQTVNNGATMYRAQSNMGLCNALASGSNGYTSCFATLTPAINVVGVWSLSRVSDNNQKGIWPGGTFNIGGSIPLNGQQRTALGRLFTGSSTLSVDWVRARMYADQAPTQSLGVEQLNPNYTPCPAIIAIPITASGPASCASPARLTAPATGQSFAFTGPGGYVFSNVYRNQGSYTAFAEGIKLGGTYTLTVSSGEGCPTATSTITVQGPTSCP